MDFVWLESFPRVAADGLNEQDIGILQSYLNNILKGADKNRHHKWKKNLVNFLQRQFKENKSEPVGITVINRITQLLKIEKRLEIKPVIYELLKKVHDLFESIDELWSDSCTWDGFASSEDILNVAILENEVEQEVIEFNVPLVGETVKEINAPKPTFASDEAYPNSTDQIISLSENKSHYHTTPKVQKLFQYSAKNGSQKDGSPIYPNPRPRKNLFPVHQERSLSLEPELCQVVWKQKQFVYTLDNKAQFLDYFMMNGENGALYLCSKECHITSNNMVVNADKGVHRKGFSSHLKDKHGLHVTFHTRNGYGDSGAIKAVKLQPTTRIPSSQSNAKLGNNKRDDNKENYIGLSSNGKKTSVIEPISIINYQSTSKTYDIHSQKLQHDNRKKFNVSSNQSLDDTQTLLDSTIKSSWKPQTTISTPPSQMCYVEYLSEDLGVPSTASTTASHETIYETTATLVPNSQSYPTSSNDKPKELYDLINYLNSNQPLDETQQLLDSTTRSNIQEQK